MTNDSRYLFQQHNPVNHRVYGCYLQNSRCLARNNRRHNRCQRWTFRQPFCLQHARDHIGVTVRRSPVAGCGLFATRLLRKGTVLFPYTGDRLPTAQGYPRGQAGLAYGFGTGRGEHIDASCDRGLAAYVNHRSDHAGANVAARVATITTQDRIRFFSVLDPKTGMCDVLSPHVRGRAVRNRYRQWHWRHIHRDSLDNFLNRTQIWFVTKRDIPIGQELLLDYHNANLLTISNSTVPRIC
jgi:hypothetical protein